MAAQIPDKSVVEEVAHLYLDAVYSVPLPGDHQNDGIIIADVEPEDGIESDRSQSTAT